MSEMDRVKKIMAAVLSVDIETIGDDSSVDDMETWDSLRHINLIIALEQEFGISLPDEEVASLTSVRLLTMAISDAVRKG